MASYPNRKKAQLVRIIISIQLGYAGIVFHFYPKIAEAILYTRLLKLIDRQSALQRSIDGLTKDILF